MASEHGEVGKRKKVDEASRSFIGLGEADMSRRALLADIGDGREGIHLNPAHRGWRE